MKKIYYYLPIAALAFGLTSCGGGAKKTESEVQKTFDMSNLDPNVSPGESFYDFATGGWTKANALPAEYSRFGTFEELARRNEEQVKGIIEELEKSEHEAGSLNQKIGDLYSIAMDSVKLEADRGTPIYEELDKIKSAKTTADIINLVGEIRIYARSPFFGFGVGPDAKNSTMNIVHLGQGGLGMGNREYYLNEDERSKELRAGYVNLIKTQFINLDYTAEQAEKAANDVMKIETEIAKNHFTKEFVRDREKNYHKLSYAELNTKVAKFDWDAFFKAATATGFDELNVAQIEPVRASVKMIQTLPIEEVKAYLSWCVVSASSSYLSNAFGDANFDFFGKQMSGREAQQDRWKRSVGAVNSILSEAMGQIYVERYFPAEAKERMLKLVGNLQETFGERIDELDWMSDETKAKAHDKLNSFTVKIGYPDTWKDYTNLEIKKDSYWANVKRYRVFDYVDNIGRIGKEVDKTEWGMPPQMVNAYYRPSSNEICFPAGILQPPFFYLEADDAVNYGAIGVVIGHEMSHGFDDQGSKYDQDGNMFDWWTAADRKQFEERADVLVNHFDQIEVAPGVMANGRYTLGENIGDFGGIQISYHAFSKTEEAKAAKKLEGYSPQQRFFLSYAGVWAANIRDEEVLRRTKEDVHSLGKWRVDGTLPHINAWYDAFNITESDTLYLAKEKRADIW